MITSTSQFNYIDQAPKDILLEVFSYLDPRSKQRAMRTCKKWQLYILEAAKREEKIAMLAFTVCFAETKNSNNRAKAILKDVKVIETDGDKKSTSIRTMRVFFTDKATSPPVNDLVSAIDIQTTLKGIKEVIDQTIEPQEMTLFSEGVVLECSLAKTTFLFSEWLVGTTFNTIKRIPWLEKNGRYLPLLKNYEKNLSDEAISRVVTKALRAGVDYEKLVTLKRSSCYIKGHANAIAFDDFATSSQIALEKGFPYRKYFVYALIDNQKYDEAFTFVSKAFPKKASSFFYTAAMDYLTLPNDNLSTIAVAVEIATRMHSGKSFDEFITHRGIPDVCQTGYKCALLFQIANCYAIRGDFANAAKFGELAKAEPLLFIDLLNVYWMKVTLKQQVRDWNRRIERQ